MNIKQFAKEIGVSTATVSRAIHGHKYVDTAKRQMVLRRMEELGYTPNVNGRRLVTGRNYLMALDDRRPGLFTDPFGMQLARGIQQALQNSGYSLLLNTATGAEEENDQLRRWVHSRTVDGVLVVRSSDTAVDLIRDVSQACVPCVVIGTWTESLPNVVSVGIRDTGLVQAARLLVEQGHRRIGVIDTADGMLARSMGDELERLGAPLAPHYRVIVPFPASADAPSTEVRDGAEAMETLLAQTPRPTAVLAFSDALALGAIRAANRRGLRVPADVSVIGYEDLPLAEYADPPLTSVRLDCAVLGRTATEALLKLIEQPEAATSARTVETTLIRRHSVGSAPN